MSTSTFLVPSEKAERIPNVFLIFKTRSLKNTLLFEGLKNSKSLIQQKIYKKDTNNISIGPIGGKNTYPSRHRIIIDNLADNMAPDEPKMRKRIHVDDPKFEILDCTLSFDPGFHENYPINIISS